MDLSLVHAAHRIVTFAECASEHLAAAQGGLVGYGPRARELIDLGVVTPAHAYVHAQHVRHDTAWRLAAMFTDADVILLPVVPEPAPARATTGDSRLQIPWTLCGFAALYLPTGITSSGLPLAMQFIADRYNEPALLTAAHWSEQVLGLNLVPPLHSVHQQCAEAGFPDEILVHLAPVLHVPFDPLTGCALPGAATRLVYRQRAPADCNGSRGG